MKTVLEKAGDRILRAVLPKTDANACSIEQWYAGSTDQGKITLYDALNTCNGEKGCHLWGPSTGIDEWSWGSYC